MKDEENRKYVKVFLMAVLAGVTIGIGGAVFLSVDNRIAGALLFTVGLYTICIQKLNLFTGKVGYLPDKDSSYLIELAVIWLGNLFGTFLAAGMLNATRIAMISETAHTLCETKMKDGPVSLLILGIFCGLLMFIAVDGYARTQNPVILFLGVATFILCGFEHCIADMFYFSLAHMWSAGAFLRILVITLGNAVGGVLIFWAKKLVKCAEE